MTAGGYADLERELHRRKAEERPRIIAAISEARAHGDLSETPSTMPPRRRRATTRAASPSSRT